MNVFIVYGTTGEYSDRSEWAVCAYPKREDADKHADQAKLWDHKNGREWASLPYDKREKNPYDPEYTRDYTGTDYYVLECELKERFENANS